MNNNEDIDLRRLHTYNELKEAIWLIYDSKIKLLNLKAYKERTGKDFLPKETAITNMRECIRSAYHHFNVTGYTPSTFYNDVFSNYARFRLTKWILKDTLGQDPMVYNSNSYNYNKDYTIICD